MCDLKKVFVSRTTCSNAAHQLLDRLFLLCPECDYIPIGPECDFNPICPERDITQIAFGETLPPSPLNRFGVKTLQNKINWCENVTL